MTTAESQIELDFIAKLGDLKYTYRQDVRDRAALEKNFREQFEALNRVHLTDGEFSRLLEEITTPDVFTAARTLSTRSPGWISIARVRAKGSRIWPPGLIRTSHRRGFPPLRRRSLSSRMPLVIVIRFIKVA